MVKDELFFLKMKRCEAQDFVGFGYTNFPFIRKYSSVSKFYGAYLHRYAIFCSENGVIHIKTVSKHLFKSHQQNSYIRLISKLERSSLYTEFPTENHSYKPKCDEKMILRIRRSF